MLGLVLELSPMVANVKMSKEWVTRCGREATLVGH